MLFRRPLIVDSTLPVALTRARLRACATSPFVAELTTFRRRQIIGWRLSEANESFLFQPEYGDTLDMEGARFVALVEPVGKGARIRGFVAASRFTKVLLSVWMLAVAAAMVFALSQSSEPPPRIMEIGALMLGAAVALVRYSLWSTSRVIEARLRQSVDAPRASAAA